MQPIVSQKEYEALVTASDAVDPLCRLLLVLAHKTGHRIGAIRQLRWSDVSLTMDSPSVRWRAELDKIGNEHETPLSTRAVKELRRSRKGRSTIGDGWLFPSPLDSSEPISRHLVRNWWQKLETASKLAREPGRGWHSLRRKFATELKHAPTKDLQALGGWKDRQTILACYQRSDAVSMKEALQTRRQLVG
jgi:integrase